MTHTPGPWKVPGTDDGEYVIAHHDGKKLRTLAHVYDEANARLIAAAPELLAFVEMVARLTNAKHTEESEIDAVITVNRLRQVAQAALAKAQGKEGSP
jgi:hypothetical protein